MKRNLLIALMFLAVAGFAAAQIQAPATDVLGAHLNYGRGCAACHAPHSGARGNGYAAAVNPTPIVGGPNAGKTFDDHANTGVVALWGEDVSNLLGQTLTFGNNTSETLPSSISVNSPDVSGVLMCLSCHDGNFARGAMMKNVVYETLPSTYGTSAIPTLLGADGSAVNNYLNDHPVGLNAIISCGGSHDWDCTISAAGAVQMTGTNSTKFVTNYGFFVRPSVNAANQPVVMCTTCHNQHLMNVVSVTNGKNTGLPTGNYATMFFVRAPYNPASGTAGSNQTAQFCRQCHGGESNEMAGGTAVTTF